MKPKWKTQIFFIFIILHFNLLSECLTAKWDYIKGGADWAKECKTGDQSPIDISAPFTFKSS